MASRRYLNFDLLLEQEGEGRYQARVTDSPLGETPGVRFQLPFDATTLENLLLKLDPGRSGTRRVGGTSQQQAAMDFGGPLYQAVFTGDLALAWQRSLDRARAEQAGGLRLRLRLNDAPAIAGLPWELLYDAKTNSFIAQSERTPVVRFLDVPQVPRPMAVDGPLRVLAIISSPIDLEELDVEAEWRRIGEALAPRVQAGLVVVDRLPSATLANLGTWLRRQQTHVIHFVGHGDFDDQLREGVIYFQDQHGRGSPVTSSVLGPYLRDHDPLRMVVLNACRSARSDAVDPFGGMAQGLVQQDAQAVVAMQFPISDRAAVTFTGEFYGALVDGLPVDQAVSSARKSLLADFRDEWSTPVLFLRSPDGNIFENVHAVTGGVPDGPPPPPKPPGPSFWKTVRWWVDRNRPLAVGIVALVVVVALVAGLVWLLPFADDGSRATDDATDPTSEPTPSVSDSELPGKLNGEQLPGGPELEFDEMLVAAGDSSRDLQVFRVRVGSTEPPLPLTDGDDGVAEQGPALGPKRDTFVFTALQPDGSRSLRVSAPDGSRQRALFPESMDFCSGATERPAWPKGGARRVVTVCREPGEPARLLLLGFDGEIKLDYEVVAGNFGDPAISPTTDTLMFWANDRAAAGGGFLFQVPLAGGTPTPITSDHDPGDAEADPDQDSDAVFSPDGKLIAFRRTDAESGNRDIWVANADGTDARQVTFSGTADQDPTFSPTSDFIAYKHDETNAAGIRTGDTRIYIIPVTPVGSPPAAPIPMLATPIADVETLPAWSRR
jgi:hypothetical protein